MLRAAALLAVLAACGGGASEQTSTEPQQLPPAEAEAPPADLDVGLPQDPPADADGLPPASVKLAELEPGRVSGDLAGLTPATPGAFAARLCLDAKGEPSAIKLMRSSGDRAFDRSVLERLVTWRFKPFQVETVAVGVCTVVRL